MFVLVRLEGEAFRLFMDHCLLAIWTEFFLFPRGTIAAVIVAAATAVAATSAAITTLGECCHEFCVLGHNFRHLFALLHKFSLEESKGIKCRCGGDG